jgi:tetratricopeptide (TPR) repeat protein
VLAIALQGCSRDTLFAHIGHKTCAISESGLGRLTYRPLASSSDRRVFLWNQTALAYEKVTYEYDWSGAQAAFRRALELNPNSADTHYLYALTWLTPTGRRDEAIGEIKKALALDPVSLPRNAGAGYVFYYARRYQDALDQCGRTISLDPSYPQGHWRCFEAYRQLGRYDDAIREKEKAWLLDGEDRRTVEAATAALRQATAKSGERGYWQQEVEIYKRFASPVAVADAYARLAKTNDAFEWLEKGFQSRDSDAVMVAVDPNLDSIRSDPRYKNLLRRIGLPQ